MAKAKKVVAKKTAVKKVAPRGAALIHEHIRVRMDGPAQKAFGDWANGKTQQAVDTKLGLCHQLGMDNRNGNIGLVEVKQALK